MSDPDQYRRRTVLKMSGTAAAAAVTAGAATPAAAQTSDEASGVFDDSTVSGRVVAGAYFLFGMADGAAETVNVLSEDETAIDEHVSGAVSELEGHSGDWVTYVNDRDLGGRDRQTAEVTFRYQGEEMVRYLNATWDADAGEYSSFDIETPEEWGGGGADATATVTGDAVANAESELRQLHEQFIEPNQDITRSYASRLAGRYYWEPNDYVTSSLLG